MRPETSELVRLLASIRACRLCADTPLGAPLPHAPLPYAPRPVLRASGTARLAVCSQAPGTRVHATGIPFTDASGDRLRDWMGIDPQTFYDESRIAIIPMGFCFAGQDAKGGDLPPRTECAARWHRSLFAALPQLELVFAVGSYAQNWHLGGEGAKTLQATMLGWRDHGGTNRPRVLPLPHPSWRNNGWLKRNAWFEVELLPVLRHQVRSRI
jgi:uracil-DNA glycosylase